MGSLHKVQEYQHIVCVTDATSMTKRADFKGTDYKRNKAENNLRCNVIGDIKDIPQRW